MKQNKMWLLLSILLSYQAQANSVVNDMQHFLKSMQQANNVTHPQAYHGQAGGYYTGGSLYVRGRVQNAPIAHVQLPSLVL